MSYKLYNVDVLLPFLVHDIFRPNFNNCIMLLQLGGIIPKYIMTEVVYNYANHFLRKVAEDYAAEAGESEICARGWRTYVRKRPALRYPGWRKEMYARFHTAMNDLLSSYPGVQIEDFKLYQEAVCIAEETGFDWTDCLLIAETRVKVTVIQSLDGEILQRATPPMKPAGPVSKMNLA